MMSVNTFVTKNARSLFLLALASLVVAGCENRERAASSSSSWCLEFDQSGISGLKARNTLESARKLRDFYMECDTTGRHAEEALVWAKKAAELGNAEDKRIDQGLIEANAH